MPTARSTVSPGQPGYPELLATIRDLVPDPLYIEGDAACLQSPLLSIVGSRKMSDYAARVMRQILPPLAASGFVIVSGLAYGVDACAHEIALESGGRCVVVLGSGLDQVYPVANQGLYRRIIEQGGCAFSEYEPATPPRAFRFPERNRIIAGLSPVTLIIEAGEQSGTLITARSALEYGRDVAVVPGDITREQSKGIVGLLRQGAIAVASAEDVAALYRQQLRLLAPEELRPALTGSMATLYDLISHGVNSTDELVRSSGLPVSSTLSVLSVLEMDGYITKTHTTWQKTL